MCVCVYVCVYTYIHIYTLFIIFINNTTFDITIVFEATLSGHRKETPLLIIIIKNHHHIL